MPRETLALEARRRGDSCLREGQCAEARAAFHQARALDPKLPYVIARLDAVERGEPGDDVQSACGARFPSSPARFPHDPNIARKNVTESASDLEYLLQQS
jgi:hypothetical protein